MRKVSFVFLLAVALTVLFSGKSAFADPMTPSPTATPGATTGIRQQNQQTKTASLTARADKEISRRIDALNKIISRINEIKKLTASDKSALTSQVQAEIAGLTTLKAKIDADTDPNTLKMDVQSIVKSYRVYVVFIPKIHIIAASDRVIAIVAQMNSLADKLQFRVTAAQGKGKDVATLTTLLADMRAKLTDAQAQALNAISTVMPLTPDGYPANKTQLQSARTMLKTAIQDLLIARQDGRKIIQGLRQLQGATDTTKLSPSVTSNGTQGTGATASGRTQ